MSDFNNETETENKAITETEAENKATAEAETKADNRGVVSLVLGIISLVTSCIFFISIPVGIVGLVMGVKCKDKNGTCKAGITLSIIGLVLTVILLVASFFAGVSSFISSDNKKVFEGEGFRLPYDYNWSKVSAETTDGSDAHGLQYRTEQLYLVSVGYSMMPCSPSDFEDASTQKEIYDYFFNYWDDIEADGDTAKVFEGSNGFQKLTDEIYYATYTYGFASDNIIKGNYYLLLSPQKNAVLSFMTEDKEHSKKNQDRIIALLKNIEIQEPTSYVDEDSNTIYNDNIARMLESLSPWNRYSELREGTLGKKKTLEGGWRALDDSSEYWKFENGHFWYYRSVDDLDDNYWYGTTEILKGKEAFYSMAGSDEDTIDEMLEHSSGQVTEDDLYTIIFTPTQIISGGVDKSSTNIPEGLTWHFTWIMIDHGLDGIEGQALNVDNGEVYYLVKLND